MSVESESDKTIFVSVKLVADFFLVAHRQNGDVLVIEAIPGHITATTKID